MTSDKRLENYLSRLDKALSQFDIGERAEIITEIKSHILTAQEKEPATDLSSILASMGEPETVANRYRIERGLKPVKPSRGPIVKWLTIGFLGTFAISVLFVSFVIWRFSPVVSIDGENETVSILGGLIDIDGKAETIKIGGSIVDGQYAEVTGEEILDSSVTNLDLRFTNGRFEIRTTDQNTLSWTCKYARKDKEVALFSRVEQTAVLNLKDTWGAKCRLEVPEVLATSIQGANGKVEYWNPKRDIDINISNGKVGVFTDHGRKFRFDLKAVNGRIKNDLSSSSSPEDPLIKIALDNGKIEIE